MTQQYMAGYPPVQQQSPGTGFPGDSHHRSASYGGRTDTYNPPPSPPVQDHGAYSGPPSHMRAYSQPGYDPYAQPQTSGQLALYNQQNQLVPHLPVAADGTLLPPAVAPDGTLLPPPLAPDGTLLPPPIATDGAFPPGPRQRTYSTDSRRSSHSHRSQRSSRSARSRKEAEIERRPTWADSVIAVWDAFKGAFDRRRV